MRDLRRPYLPHSLCCCCRGAQSCPTLGAQGLQPVRLLSMGFSRQEHWSGLPFPTPGYTVYTDTHTHTYIWKWKVKLLVAQLCPSLHDAMDCSPPAPLSMEFSRQEYWSVLPFSSPGDRPNSGTEPGSPALQDSSSEPPGNIYTYIYISDWHSNIVSY